MGPIRDVTLPGLRQTMLFVTVIGVIASLQAFDQVYVMTRGGPLFTTETLVTYMYHQGFDLFRMGYAAAIAWVLFVIIMAGSAVQLRLFPVSRCRLIAALASLRGRPAPRTIRNGRLSAFRDSRWRSLSRSPPS